MSVSTIQNDVFGKRIQCRSNMNVGIQIHGNTKHISLLYVVYVTGSHIIARAHYSKVTCYITNNNNNNSSSRRMLYGSSCSSNKKTLCVQSSIHIILSDRCYMWIPLYMRKREKERAKERTRLRTGDTLSHTE